jgi:outer membrane protein TolC
MTFRRLVATGALALLALLSAAATSSAAIQGLATAQSGSHTRPAPNSPRTHSLAPPAVQSLSLPEALRRALGESEGIGIAQAGVTRANGQEMTARSQFFPQIFASAGYTKTLKSQFESFSSGGGSDDDVGPAPPAGPCGQYLRDATASIDDRVAGVETATRCVVGRSSFDGLDDLPFGQENQWSVGLQLSQTLFSGGRVSAAYAVARAGHRLADIELASQEAQLEVQVTEAYYDAVLADELLAIADSARAQTAEALRQTALAREVGDKSEFDLLRAQVTYDNQAPVVASRRSDRELAHLRLKQLLGISSDTPLQLTTGIPDDTTTLAALTATADTIASNRASVRQAEEAVSAQEGLLRIQRADRLPAVNLTSQYGKVGYPSGVFPSWGDFLDNWTIGVGLQVPIFTGGRLRGSEISAGADVSEARLRVDQVKEAAALDARATITSLRDAEETLRASGRTVDQAQRAYEIAEVRFREGISTQLELSESRVLLQQARANRAVAARNLQVMQVRLRLLPDLPLAGAASQQSAAAQQQLQQQVQLQMQERTQQQQSSQAGTTAAGATGGTGQIGGTGGGEDR